MQHGSINSKHSYNHCNIARVSTRLQPMTQLTYIYDWNLFTHQLRGLKDMSSQSRYIYIYIYYILTGIIIIYIQLYTMLLDIRTHICGWRQSHLILAHVKRIWKVTTIQECVVRHKTLFYLQWVNLMNCNNTLQCHSSFSFFSACGLIYIGS